MTQTQLTFIGLTLLSIVLMGCDNAPKENATVEEAVVVAEQIADPLPSWNEGETKTAITRFVTNVTTEGSPDFVPSAQRIAAFDNDGTLWVEQPVAQLEFITYQIKKMSGQHPEWKTQQPFKAVLEGDQEYLINDITKNHGKGLQEMILAAHAGMTLQEFNESVREFFNTEQHPKFKKSYTQTTYQPMLELLAYLRENGFKTYISSGGGVDLMRVIAMDTYGIVPENVIGTFAIDSFEQVDGEWKIVKSAKNMFLHDALTKPVGIKLRIGRIPIFVGGNVRTGGDIGQLTPGEFASCPNSSYVVFHIMVGDILDTIEHPNQESYPRPANPRGCY